MLIISVFLSTFLTSVLCDVPPDYLPKHHEFSVDLVKILGKGHKKNVVYSTLSIESILALMALGSKGTTSTEIKKILKLPESDEEIKSIYTDIYSSVNKYDEVKIMTANRVYLADKIEVEPSFKKTANDVFQTGVENINFENVENATEHINSWVTEQMEEKIKKIIKKDHLGPDTKMVLVNTLHFQGSWQYPFPKDKTEKKDFHVTETDTVPVDTMVVSGNFLIYRNEKLKVSIIGIPFVDTNNTRPILCFALPDEMGGLDELEKEFKIAVNEQLHYNYSQEYMKLYIPKFRVDSSNNMKPILQDLGIKEIFEKPDFSRITKDSIKVDTFVQKIVLEINENGTEGASESLVASPGDEKFEGTPKEIHVDRPFFFGLQYDQYLLMAGRITKPHLG